MTSLMVLGIITVAVFALYVIDDLGKYHMDKKYGGKEK